MILEFIDHEYNYISKDHTASIYKTTLLLEVEGNLKYLQHLDLYSKQFLPILLYSAVDQGVSHRMPKSSSSSSNTATTPSRNLGEKGGTRPPPCPSHNPCHVLQDGAYEGGDTRGTPHAEAEAAKAPCKETDLLVPQLTVMCCIAASFVDTCIVWVNFWGASEYIVFTFRYSYGLML